MGPWGHVPVLPAPPEAGYAVAAAGPLWPGTRGCTGSSGSLLVAFGNLLSGSGTAPSWPA